MTVSTIISRQYSMLSGAFLLLIHCSVLHAQPVAERILECSYSQLPFPTRIEHSGIYGVASFDVRNGSVYLSRYGSDDVYAFKTGNVQSRQLAKAEAADLSIEVEPMEASRGLVRISKCLNAGESIRLNESGGTFTADGKVVGEISLNGRNGLQYTLALGSRTLSCILPYPGTLMYANLVGVDASGNSFIETETVETEMPLRVRRHVVVLSADGGLRATLDVPMVKYCSTIRDLALDDQGNLCHLMTRENGILVLRWKGLTDARGSIAYPSEYRRAIHFNDVIPTDEAPVPTPGLAKTTAVSSRVEALRIGETYAYHRYTCSAANLSPTDVTDAGGDVVRTPAWLIVGRNSHVAYKWGGFSTLAQYDAGLAAGKYAADINTAGVSSYAVGVDCSGFVSRCWQLSSHYATSSMTTNTSMFTQMASWDAIRPGDAILKSGHVRLFVERTKNGAFRVVESSGRDWGVAYWTYTASDLNGVYYPCMLNQMVSDYSTQRPELLGATSTTGGIRLQWSCDTSSVLGYRLYKSTDGIAWARVADETTLRSMETSVAWPPTGTFYRISSVLANGSLSESPWSNALAVRSAVDRPTVLIVDGFARETGSWRGPGHTFAVTYAQALPCGYESVKRSAIPPTGINPKTYPIVIWIAGDQSNADTVLTPADQAVLKQYLENGGSLLISGSEIGYSLANGTDAMKSFFANYLKAAYVSDNAGVTTAVGRNFLTDLAAFNFGQVYPEDYPDEIGTAGGSVQCMAYGNSKVAGVSYAGTFGASVQTGKLLYFAFPLETIADETVFSLIIAKSIQYLTTSSGIPSETDAPSCYALSPNYPNPFNPSTTIRYGLPVRSRVELSVYNVLGQKVCTLVGGEQTAGYHEVRWNASAASGVYLYRFEARATDNPAYSFTKTGKMLLVR